MKINIWVGPFYPIPPTKGLAVERRQFAMAAEYAKHGHEVTMISRLYEERPADELVDGIRHIRVKSWNEPKSRFLYRVMDIIYAFRVRKVVPQADITVLNSVASPLIAPQKAGLLHVSVGRFPKGQMGFYRRAARLLAPSSAVARAIVVQSPSMKNRVRIVPNAISADFADAARRTLESDLPPARDNEIVFLGRIAKEKGLELLISAFAQVAVKNKDWTLSIIGPSDASGGGDGPAYLDDLKALAAPLGTRVRFDGAIYDTAVLISRLQKAGLFVYPSLAEKGETFGVAPVEAMACGCPVILSKLECFRDFVTDGENGIVFNHRSNAVENLSEAILRMIGMPDERDKISKEAILSSQRFFPSQVAKMMLVDFHELISQNEPKDHT